MPRIGTNHSNNALATNDFALVADLFDARTNLHDRFLDTMEFTRSSMTALEVSSECTRTLTLSPGLMPISTLRASTETEALTILRSSNSTL